jgi:hypothetical protein
LSRALLHTHSFLLPSTSFLLHSHPSPSKTGISQEAFEKQYAKKTGTVLADLMGVSAADVKYDPTKTSQTPKEELQPTAEKAPKPKPADKPKTPPVVQPKPAPDSKEDKAVADLAAKAAAEIEQAKAKKEGTAPKFTTGDGEQAACLTAELLLLLLCCVRLPPHTLTPACLTCCLPCIDPHPVCIHTRLPCVAATHRACCCCAVKRL